MIGKFEDSLPEKFKPLNKYKTGFNPDGSYNKLRNKVMHPIKQIINDGESINQINKLLLDYPEIKKIIES